MIISDLCHENGECNYWTYEEDAPSQIFDCSLLSSCHLQQNISSYPKLVNSGDRFCQPEAFKRRACRPFCPASKKFCHGRCVYPGHQTANRCLFSVCSKSPFREDGAALCSQLALEAAEEDCQGVCDNIATDSEADQCQTCINQQLSDLESSHCLELSGSLCWGCIASVKNKLESCSQEDPMATIQCIQQDQAPKCRSCVCTLLCYMLPGGDLCTTCQHQPDLASLFLHNGKCDQGWVWSAASSQCYKAFSDLKILHQDSVRMVEASLRNPNLHLQ